MVIVSVLGTALPHAVAGWKRHDLVSSKTALISCGAGSRGRRNLTCPGCPVTSIGTSNTQTPITSRSPRLAPSTCSRLCFAALRAGDGDSPQTAVEALGCTDAGAAFCARVLLSRGAILHPASNAMSTTTGCRIVTSLRPSNTGVKLRSSNRVRLRQLQLLVRRLVDSRVRLLRLSRCTPDLDLEQHRYVSHGGDRLAVFDRWLEPPRLYALQGRGI